MRSKQQKLESAIPTKWPQILPNLSTHNGKPQLIVKSSSDYILVLSNYKSFVVRMIKLKDHWTFSLRALYKLLGAIKNIDENLCIPRSPRSIPHDISKGTSMDIR